MKSDIIMALAIIAFVTGIKRVLHKKKKKKKKKYTRNNNKVILTNVFISLDIYYKYLLFK